MNLLILKNPITLLGRLTILKIRQLGSVTIFFLLGLFLYFFLSDTDCKDRSTDLFYRNQIDLRHHLDRYIHGNGAWVPGILHPGEIWL